MCFLNSVEKKAQPENNSVDDPLTLYLYRMTEIEHMTSVASYFLYNITRIMDR